MCSYQSRRRISGLAATALALSILGPVLLLGPLLGINTRGRMLPLYGSLVASAILGGAALVRIRLSNWRLAGWNAAIASVAVSALGLLAAPTLFYPWVVEWPCHQNLEMLSVSLAMYAQEHDGLLPPAERWSDCLDAWSRSYPLEYSAPVNPLLFVCPEAPGLRSGYAFNRALGGLSMGDIRKTPHPERTVMLFESDLGWNGTGGPESLVKTPRHRGRDVFAYAVGELWGVQSLARSQQRGLIWRPPLPGRGRRR